MSARPPAPTAGQRSAGRTWAATARFDPIAASFVTASTGWVLGDTHWAAGAAACQGCAGLLHTSDGGRSWRALPAPPSPVGANDSPADAITGIAFANAEDGFLYGPVLLTSHDGGRSWVRVNLPPVQELVLGRGYADLGFVTTDTGFVVGPADLDAVAPDHVYRTDDGGRTWQAMRLQGV